MIADPLVQATVTLENGEETVLTGLNEITFRRSIQTIKADVYLNKQLFERFNGDGDSVFQLQRAQLLITSHQGDEGYQTPKIETRAAIFKDAKILLVRERMAQEWSLPGGWNDYDQTTAQNCVKEAKEESGRIVKPVKLIAVQDRNHHNKPILATNVTKIFYLCKEISREFVPNDETDACDYFALDNLPKLSLDRNTKEQIEMCFKVSKNPNWQTLFE